MNLAPLPLQVAIANHHSKRSPYKERGFESCSPSLAGCDRKSPQQAIALQGERL
ncbi:hypothetical protein [Nostoc sp. TCL26-01]|uniref:hypothetical protein n=1 Tax=Nostoc sp. TCL26-01 TaxID=2576904 RepID=UPI0015BCCDBD|nr:hypothetical protein [Nostoc sp. TCL26-01]